MASWRFTVQANSTLYRIEISGLQPRAPLVRKLVRPYLASVLTQYSIRDSTTPAVQVRASLLGRYRSLEQALEVVPAGRVGRVL